MYIINGPLPRFIGNIPASNAKFVELAVAETGFDVRVSDEAVDVRGWPIDGVSVWTFEPRRDHASFWAAYRRLMDQQ